MLEQKNPPHIRHLLTIIWIIFHPKAPDREFCTDSAEKKKSPPLRQGYAFICIKQADSDIYEIPDIVRGHGFVSQDQEPVHHVVQLADVARPGFLLEQFDRFRGETAGPAAVRVFPAEIVNQRGDVVAPLVQRRDPDHDDAGRDLSGVFRYPSPII